MSSLVPFSIRQLTSDDGALLKALLTVFGEAFAEIETYTAAQPSGAYLEHLLSGDSFIALVALNNGLVVGGVTAYELQKFEQERSEIYLVRPRCRGRAPTQEALRRR